MGYTQEELAEEMCVPKSTILAYENDKVDIKGSVIMELCGHLCTDPDYLLGFEKADKNEESELAAEMLGKIEDEKIKDSVSNVFVMFSNVNIVRALIWNGATM